MEGPCTNDSTWTFHACLNGHALGFHPLTQVLKLLGRVNTNSMYMTQDLIAGSEVRIQELLEPLNMIINASV